jgi:hypothetical protein
MSRNPQTSAVADSLLRFIATGGFIGASLLLPGLTIALDKPLHRYLHKLDERDRQREIHRVLRYMKKENLINYSEKYEHGITITVLGKKRLERANYHDIEVQQPAKWDQKWRLVIFDIPEERKQARNALAAKLRSMGFQPLQRSVWIHPFSCHPEIEAIAMYLKVTEYLTYAETSYIDNPERLKTRFSSVLKT